MAIPGYVPPAPPTDPPADPPPADPPPPPADPPPPAAESALERALEAERKRTRDLEKAIADLNKKNMSDTERALAEAKEQGKAEALAESQAEVRIARVEVVAAELGFHDPKDAVSMVTATEPAEIRKELEKIAADKPYLIKGTNGTPPPPIGQGSRGGPPPKDANSWLRETMNSRR